MKKGFTLLELIVVVIIVGVLGSLGFAQYTKVVEKSRTAEAKAILGALRSAQEAYRLQYGGYTATLANLSTEAPAACSSVYYFTYGVSATSGTATRCTTGGKSPQGAAAYTLTLNYATGEWGGSAGYY
ncbi:MAG: prepilin-type N-terminal cleavage/methylation domain-containing protein [Candidatus Omnitrophota bacterium]|jgi:type IV pilus assembly protein PilE